MPISNNGVYTSPSLENASDELKNMHNSELFKRLERANGIYEASYLSERWYSAFSRTGNACPQTMVNGGREYLFFTKPDLHFFEPGTTDLNEELQPYNLFREAVTTFPNEMAQLQFSSSRKYSTNNGTSNLTANQYGIDTQLNTRSPFMNLLSNSVAGSLELPTISAATTYETAQNIDGMKMLYRKSSFASDHDYEFTLEFSDTRDLNVYMLFKLYDEYERLKSDGSVTPPNIGYTLQKQLHDQFSIYKFIVDNDGTTILHYSKLTGVFPTSVPREAFSDMSQNSNGLKFAVNFKATFVDDMKPMILAEFNYLVKDVLKNQDEMLLYDYELGQVSGEWATIPYITKMKDPPNNFSRIYRLRWR